MHALSPSLHCDCKGLCAHCIHWCRDNLYLLDSSSAISKKIITISPPHVYLYPTKVHRRTCSEDGCGNRNPRVYTGHKWEKTWISDGRYLSSVPSVSVIPWRSWKYAQLYERFHHRVMQLFISFPTSKTFKRCMVSHCICLSLLSCYIAIGHSDCQMLCHTCTLYYLSCTRSGWLPYHWDFHIKTEEVQFGDIHWHSGLGWWWHEVSFWCWRDYHMAGRNVWPSLCAVWSPWPSSLQTNTQHSWYVHVNMLPVV